MSAVHFVGNPRRLLAPTMIVLAGVSLLAGKPSTWTPVTATFRCAAGETCGTLDGLRSDGMGSYAQLSSSEGAFLNQFGGFTIRLFSNTIDRSLWLDLSQKVSSSDGPCGFTPTTPVFATEAELRINVQDAQGNAVGLESLTTGLTYAGFGILNYSDGQANVLWTVRWNSGDVLVMRTAANAWTIRSSNSGQALLQCTATKGRTPGGDEATYVLPFLVTVTKP